MIAINLIPKPLQQQRVRRLRTIRWLISCIISLSALGIVAGMDWLDRAAADDLLAKNDELHNTLLATRATLTDLATSSEKLGLQIERAEALHAKRAWSGMISMIAAHMPADMWLTSVATVPNAPMMVSSRNPRRAATKPGDGEAEPEAITIEAPRKLSIQGFTTRAADAMALVTGLKKESIFDSVVLIQSERTKTHGKYYFRFEISCEW
ncbi:MAG: PilN domain-containing protein [Planctomycetota bacterium]